MPSKVRWTGHWTYKHRPEIITTGTAPEPAITLGLVGEKPMPPGPHDLLEATLADSVHARYFTLNPMGV
jgi:hypothetical protein